MQSFAEFAAENSHSEARAAWESRIGGAAAQRCSPSRCCRWFRRTPLKCSLARVFTGTLARCGNRCLNRPGLPPLFSFRRRWPSSSKVFGIARRRGGWPSPALSRSRSQCSTGCGGSYRATGPRRESGILPQPAPLGW